MLIPLLSHFRKKSLFKQRTAQVARSIDGLLRKLNETHTEHAHCYKAL
jgi:hypothetical protein